MPNSAEKTVPTEKTALDLTEQTEPKQLTPMKAIREKCLDCSCGNKNEVKLCTAANCPLHPFRTGHNPYKAKRVYTDQQKADMAERLRKARDMQN